MDRTTAFFVSVPEIVTDRLVLRKIAAEDAHAIFEYASNDQVTKYVMFPTHRTLSDSREFIYKILSQKGIEIGSVWAIVLKENNKTIGTIGTHKIDTNHHKLETGYALNDNYWGKGYVTEALGALIKAIFLETDINRIEAYHVEEHEASGRVMQKNGMTFEGILRESTLIKGKLRNMKVYSILRKDHERSDHH